MRAGGPDGGAQRVELAPEGVGGRRRRLGAGGGVLGVADGAARAVERAALGVARAAHVGVDLVGQPPGGDGEGGGVERAQQRGAEAALVERAVGLEVGGVGAEEREGDEERGGGAEGDAGVDAARVEARGADLGHPPRLRAEDAVARKAAREVDGVGAGERGDGAGGGLERGAQRAQRGAQRVLAAARKMDEVGERAAEYRAGAQVAGGRGVVARAAARPRGATKRRRSSSGASGCHARTTPIRPPSDSATLISRRSTVRARR